MMKPEVKIAGRWWGSVLWLTSCDAVYAPNCNIYVKRSALALDAALYDALIAHERAHHKQRLRDGWWKFWLRIVWYVVRYGYQNSPYEIEAREVQARTYRVAKGATIG